MKTTIEIPDALFHRAKVLAAQRRTTLKRLVVEALEKAITEEAQPLKPVELTAEQREIYEICDMGFPVLKKRDAVVTNEMINQMREELGI